MSVVVLGLLSVFSHAAQNEYDKQYLQWKLDQSQYVSASATVTKQASVGQVSINQADLESLQKLHGVGEQKAKAIIEYRIKNGPFKQIEALKNVKGIGDKILEKNKDILVL